MKLEENTGSVLIWEAQYEEFGGELVYRSAHQYDSIRNEGYLGESEKDQIGLDPSVASGDRPAKSSASPPVQNTDGVPFMTSS